LNIKEKFELLQGKEKIQLYLIVLMLCFLVFIFYKEIVSSLFQQKIENKVILQNTNNQKPKKLTHIELITYMNDTSKHYGVLLLESIISQNSIKIQARGKFKNIVNFMGNIEENFQIKKFEIKRFDTKIDVSVTLSTKVFFTHETKHIDTAQVANPFYVTSYMNKKNKKKEKNLVVSAIVEKEILINNEWYKIDDIVEGYKIIEMKNNQVTFVDIKTDKKIIKGIFNE